MAKELPSEHKDFVNSDMRKSISNYDLLDKLILDGIPQSQICTRLNIGKRELNRELLLDKGKAYRAYVSEMLGGYIPPTSFNRRIEESEILELIRQFKESKAICEHLGIAKTTLSKACKRFGYKNFPECQKFALGTLDISLYEGKVLTLISLGHTAKSACAVCRINYDSFLPWYNSKYLIPMKVFAKELNGKRHFELHERKEYRRHWMRGNVTQKLSKRVSTSILKCLGAGKLQNTSLILQKELGYTISDLKSHLESLFDENMNWSNYGTYWHIDHKVPVTWFTFSTSQCVGFKECWKLSNLQPKEAIANMRKGNRYAE